MTNLLPPKAKKQILFEYWFRVVCAWILVWSVCLVLGSFVLFPTYVLLSGNNQVYSESATAAIERTSEYDALSQTLNAATKQAQEISVSADTVLLSVYTDEIWSIVSEDTIEISKMSVTREEGDLQPFHIAGQAQDRQSLAQFRDALEALPYVSQVDLPIENLAKNEDIKFSLVVNVTEKDI